MSTKKKLAVVIPAFNEEASIGRVIDAVLEKGMDPVVVDDGSSDRTADIAKQKGVISVRHIENRGYEPALTSGVKEAVDREYKYVATFDADGQLNVEDLVRFQDIAETRACDLVIGIRDYRNRISEWIVAWFCIWRFNVKDPLCGLKLYKIKSAESFLPFDENKLVGMELALKMIDSGSSFVQIPIHVKRRVIGESRYGVSLAGEINIVKALLRVIQQFGISKKQKRIYK